MMTSARPIAMSRSRVQMRISLRRLLAGVTVSPAALAGVFVGAAEDRGESRLSGWVEAPRCFWSERSILGALVFIAWALQRAPHAICVFAQQCARAPWSPLFLGFLQPPPRCLAGKGRTGPVAGA